MGLDMYAWSVPQTWVIDDETIADRGEMGRPAGDDNTQGDLNEVFYWRKHHDLHGWMEQLYRSRGGTAESFNCVKVRLYPEDLDALAMDVRTGALPKTTGFFFGNNPPDDDSIDNDMKFIEEARACIADGFAVYYDSWW